MKEFDKLIETVRILRSPKGCPWDRAQKIGNYKKYLLEEAYELIEEIDRKKINSIEEELGDLFLILIVIAEMFREKGKLKLEGVLERIDAKLIHRHPHVFSGARLRTKEEVLSYWIKHKAKKKQRKTIRERLPQIAPALFLADLFFKECIHKNTFVEGSAARQADLAAREAINKLRLFAKAKNKAVILSEASLALSRAAFLCQLDLESLLKKLIFAKAAEILY